MSAASASVPVIPTEVLRRQLVDHGGKASLISSQAIPDDEHIAVVSVALNHLGNDFGAFKVFCIGPEFDFDMPESHLFVGGSNEVFIRFHMDPDEFAFLPNSFITPWRDGKTMVIRNEVRIVPPLAKGPVADRDWSFRGILVAANNTSVSLWVQALPLPVCCINGSPWGDTEFVGGVLIHQQPLTWCPQLPPVARLQGPAPFLVDCRSKVAAAARSLPSSQEYRDLSHNLLQLARAPAIVPLADISVAKLGDRQEPTSGVFFRGVEVLQPPSNPILPQLRTWRTPGRLWLPEARRNPHNPRNPVSRHRDLTW